MPISVFMKIILALESWIFKSEFTPENTTPNGDPKQSQQTKVFANYSAIQPHTVKKILPGPCRF
jgi:hypothetical protein